MRARLAVREDCVPHEHRVAEVELPPEEQPQPAQQVELRLHLVRVGVGVGVGVSGQWSGSGSGSEVGSLQHLAKARLDARDEQVAPLAVDVQGVVPHTRSVGRRLYEREQAVLPALLH